MKIELSLESFLENYTLFFEEADNSNNTNNIKLYRL